MISSALSRGRLITRLAIGIAVGSGGSSYANPQQTYERAEFAAEDLLTSGKFEGVREILREPRMVTETDLDRMREDFASHLREDIQAGRHTLDQTTSAHLIERFGTDQYARLKGAPGFRTILDRYIEDKADWYRLTDLVPQYTQLRRREHYALLIDEHGNARVDKDVLFATENGREDAEYNRNNSMTLVVTDEQVMQRVRSEAPQAIIFNGLFGDPTSHDKWLYGFDPRSAGRPTILAERHWSMQDVKSSTSKVTAEGPATELKLARQAGEVWEVLVLVLLSGKDYLTLEQREYSDLRMTRSVAFGDYRRLSDGRWYPFRRSAQFVRTEAIDDAALQRIKSGQTAPWSDEALRAADNAAVDFRMSDSFQTSLAEPDVETVESDFKLDLVPGTVVHDTRKLDRTGQPIKSVVSGGSSRTPTAEPAAGPAEVLGAARPTAAVIPAAASGQAAAEAPSRRQATIAEEGPSSGAPGVWGWVVGGGIMIVLGWMLARHFGTARA